MTDLSETLVLSQMFSQGFPVGAFAYSHGLEQAIDAKTISGSDDLQDWIEDILRHGTGSADALFAAAAYKCINPAALAKTDATCRAFAASKERLMETTLQGEAFMRAAVTTWGVYEADLTYPVAIGHCASHLRLPLEPTLAYFLQAFGSNLVAVGMRLIPIGQSDGQKIIRDLAPVCLEVAKTAVSGDLDQLSATTFLADIASMKHEVQYSRVFRT